MATPNPTPQAKYRLEPRYRAALRALGLELHREGALPAASEAGAIRALVEAELRRRPALAKNLEKNLQKTG